MSGRFGSTGVAAIVKGCLARRGVMCRFCGEACDARAIRFVPQLGGAALPLISLEHCTGCGACAEICPVKAIALRVPDTAAAIQRAAS